MAPSFTSLLVLRGITIDNSFQVPGQLRLQTRQHLGMFAGIAVRLPAVEVYIKKLFVLQQHAQAKVYCYINCLVEQFSDYGPAGIFFKQCDASAAYTRGLLYVNPPAFRV